MPTTLPQLQSGRTILRVDLRVYSLMALKKAAYRLADRCTIMLSEEDANTAKAELLCAADASTEDYVRAFLDEALDQELRAQIGASTSGLRDLILAHAFSRTRLVNSSEG